MHIQTRHRVPEQPTVLTDDGVTAFLPVFVGGTALGAMAQFDRLYHQQRSKFGKHALFIDTQRFRPDQAVGADTTLDLSLTPGDLDALRGDPQIIGPASALVVARYPHLLTPETLGAGSRTSRILTHVSCELNLHRVLDALRRAVWQLKQTANATRVVPILLSSTGGGCGSAGTLLLGAILANEANQAYITNGLTTGAGSILTKPVLMVAEPYALAQRHRPEHQAKVLANAYAFRIELALHSDWFQYAMILGLANEAAIIDQPEEIHKNLGYSLHSFCKHWGTYWKPRNVDDWDAWITERRYQGIDIPEYHFPASQHPSFASRPAAKRTLRRPTYGGGSSNGDDKSNSSNGKGSQNGQPTNRLPR